MGNHGSADGLPVLLAHPGSYSIKTASMGLHSLIDYKMSGTVPIAEVAQYMTWSLISWDYLITFDDEITLFWFSRRSWIKFLFFTNRYLGLILRIWDVIYEELVNTLGWDLCENASTISVYNICYLGTNSDLLLYVTLQLLVIESILVLRIWAIMGKRRRILWTFFGLLACSTSASIVVSLYLAGDTGRLEYGIPTLIYETIIFISAAYYGIKESGGIRSLLFGNIDPFRYGPRPIMRLLFQGTVLYFTTTLCSVPVMSFLDPRLGLTIMSVTMNHMLLGLRKQVLSDSVGQCSQGVELTTFRATTNEVTSLQTGNFVMNIGA